MTRLAPLVLALAAAAPWLPACSSLPDRDPTGEVLPNVSGRALDGTATRLPEDLRGAPAVLLVGYVQDAQFDLDRWILGLAQAGTPVRVVEVPTIDGVAGLFAARIDAGMRSGIPSEDWGSVVTLYGDDAEAIVAFTGEQRPRNGRVLLLDGAGRVVWFHDRGYSAGRLLDLDAAARALGAPATAAHR